MKTNENKVDVQKVETTMAMPPHIQEAYDVFCRDIASGKCSEEYLEEQGQELIMEDEKQIGIGVDNIDFLLENDVGTVADADYLKSQLSSMEVWNNLPRNYRVFIGHIMTCAFNDLDAKNDPISQLLNRMGGELIGLNG